ncbi:hypothetical protein AVEN_120153-1 [Araneus ventricosus]|uniref:Uncharacterized protein n=1 Tax=Araneus ventricosus TaxID=182803 RepID=A0A4Y2RA52_ARAVE|nr:hypothetical protein AVEN_169540-1 [Araneus ventricosus]GBN72664.1 hypothetical protein AVEN_120153-1 [Araneus ventricosus]
MASSFGGYQPLRLLVVRFPEGHYLPYETSNSATSEGQHSGHILAIPADSLSLAVENMVLRLEHIAEHEAGHIDKF